MCLIVRTQHRSRDPARATRRARDRGHRAAGAPAARGRTTRCSGRSRGSRSRQRSVDSSSHVKSSVNQPVSSAPSIVLVARRSANSGAVCDVSRAPDLVLVPHDEHTVLRHHDIGLDTRGRPSRARSRTTTANARVGSRARHGVRSRGAGGYGRAPPGQSYIAGLIRGAVDPGDPGAAQSPLTAQDLARECPRSDIVDLQHSAVEPLDLGV